MYDYWWHIILEVVVTLGNFLGAEQVNSSHHLPEDEVFSIKKRKMGWTFVFLSKRKKVRWRAYWMHLISQIGFAFYLLFLFFGRMLTGDFAFLHETIFLYYPFVMMFSRGVWEIGIFVYVKIKLSIKRKNNSK